MAAPPRALIAARLGDMPSRHEITKTLLIAVSTDDCGDPIGDVRIAKARLKQLVSGHIDIVTTSGGLTQVSSQVGESSFTFAVTQGVSAADIAVAAAKALAWARKCTTAKEVSDLGYATRKSSTPDFSRAGCIS